MENYPPNSRRATEPQGEAKRVEPVASATRRKKSLGKQFKNTFFNGDGRMAWNYVVFNVLVPAAKDTLADALSQGVEKIIYGDTRGRRAHSGPSHGPPGYISYNRMSQQAQRPGPPRDISSRARQQHDFDEILIASRSEAVDVLDRMYDLLSQYEVVTVADFYGLTGLTSTHTDHKWGWTELRGSQVRRVRNDGFIIELPAPEYID